MTQDDLEPIIDPPVEPSAAIEPELMEDEVMPYIYGEDKNGCYVKWGAHGHPYHYPCGNNKKKLEAKKKANEQRKAIEASKHK